MYRSNFNATHRVQVVGRQIECGKRGKPQMSTTAGVTGFPAVGKPGNLENHQMSKTAPQTITEKPHVNNGTPWSRSDWRAYAIECLLETGLEPAISSLGGRRLTH